MEFSITKLDDGRERRMGMMVLFNLLVLVLVAFGWSSYADAATVNAASCSQADVQTAVNSANDGDVVKIPNGTCAWSGGISTTKQIRIQAQNYTPTPSGTMTRSVTITNNSASVPLFTFTSGNTAHVGLVGIRFNEGSGNKNHVRFQGSGSKMPLVADCAFQIKDRYGNNPDIAAIAWMSLGGVMWNTRIEGIVAMPGASGSSFLIMSPRAWTSASTMGSLDTSGAVNVYVENSTFKDFGQAPDIDDQGRFVMRYSTIDGTSGLTHGFTSSQGGRHAEYYNNTFQNTTNGRDTAGRFFWLRAGTVLFTDNAVNSSNQGYGLPIQLSIGDNTSPTSYPMNRQPGYGHNGTSHVSDPIYIWNQTGNSAYTWDVATAWVSMVQLNRDIFVNSGAKPGYSKYTYPHPMRVVVEGGGGDTENPTIPTNLSATTISTSQIDLSWTASTDNVGIAGYDIQRCSGSGCTPTGTVYQTTGTGTTYQSTGLSPATLYRYNVRARDAAGNVSSYSSIAGATTNPLTYTVTPSAGAYGSISPSAPQTVTSGNTQQFSITTNYGYSAIVAGTCGGSPSTGVGTFVYTTTAVSANCTVAATFSVITVLPPANLRILQ